MSRIRHVLLWAVAAFALLFPWFGWGGGVAAGGVAVSAAVVTVLAVSLSLMSWLILSLVSRMLGPAGAALAIIPARP